MSTWSAKRLYLFRKVEVRADVRKRGHWATVAMFDRIVDNNNERTVRNTTGGAASQLLS